MSQGGIGLLKDKEYVDYAVLAAPAEPTGTQVHIAWGDGEGEGVRFPLAGLTATHKKFPFRFQAGATTDDAKISLTVGKGLVWAACLSLMPADNVRGLRADTLDLLRQLNAPIYRWPGGNFVSGYNWKDGIGDRDRRPARWERAWNDVEDNDFGIDEFLDFCRELKTEPLIVVNTGLGGFDEAAREVEYVNGPAESRWGGERARNGQPEQHTGYCLDIFEDPTQPGEGLVKRLALWDSGRSNSEGRTMNADDCQPCCYGDRTADGTTAATMLVVSRPVKRTLLVLASADGSRQNSTAACSHSSCV